MSRRGSFVAAIAVFAVLLLAGILYEHFVPGLSSARTEQSPIETAVATWLLHASVPPAAKERANPLGSDPADVAAGRDLFREKCETCHAYNGDGKTQIGAGEYPHPPPLHVTVASMSDGEMFYHIRNGIRNTGMPAWDMPDQQIWQLVLFVRSLPKTAALAPETAVVLEHGRILGAHYVGSVACKNCHEAIYQRWRKSRMANVVRDPREHPEAIIPDLSKAGPAGHLHERRHRLCLWQPLEAALFQKNRRRLFPAACAVGRHAQDVAAVISYRTTLIGGRPCIPPDNLQRPTGPLCDGCHSVNYNIADQDRHRMERRLRAVPRPRQRACQPTRYARQHPQSGAAGLCARANDTCIQCHSQGQPLANPIEGKYYDWPVGFHVG